MQPGKALNTSKGDDTPLVKAVYQKITTAPPQEHTLVHTSSQLSHVPLSVKIPKETDRYAPWVEATNNALQMLKTVHVDDIREPSLLNILAQRNDPNEGSDANQWLAATHITWIGPGQCLLWHSSFSAQWG